MRAFSIQWQISPLNSPIWKPNQAKLIMYNLGENNFNEQPMQNKWKLTLSLASCYHQYSETNISSCDVIGN